MLTNRIDTEFAERRGRKRGALLPYFTAGYPDLPTTLDLILAADAAGAVVVEIGFPYSDSIADGPVIQQSFHEVLASGLRLRDVFELASNARSRMRAALVAMVSCAIVHRAGIDSFMDQARASGLDGVIVPDVPEEECAPLRAAAERAGLCAIGQVAPSTSQERRAMIAGGSTGFIYQVARAGTTGERSELPPELSLHVAELRTLSNLPICVGFGVSTREHVREICSMADGAIVGSALIRRIREARKTGASRTSLVEQVSDYLRDLEKGTNSH